MNEIRAWLKQPTTIAALSAASGTIVALLLRQIDWMQAVPLLLAAAVAAVMPDNTAAKQDAETLSNTIVNKIGKMGPTQ